LALAFGEKRLGKRVEVHLFRAETGTSQRESIHPQSTTRSSTALAYYRTGSFGEIFAKTCHSENDPIPDVSADKSSSDYGPPF